MDRRDFLKTASFASIRISITWTGVSLPDVDTGYSTILDLHAPAEVERLYHIECKNRKL